MEATQRNRKLNGNVAITGNCIDIVNVSFKLTIRADGRVKFKIVEAETVYVDVTTTDMPVVLLMSVTIQFSAVPCVPA